MPFALCPTTRLSSFRFGKMGSHIKQKRIVIDQVGGPATAYQISHSSLRLILDLYLSGA